MARSKPNTKAKGPPPIKPKAANSQRSKPGVAGKTNAPDQSSLTETLKAVQAAARPDRANGEGGKGKATAAPPPLPSVKPPFPGQQKDGRSTAPAVTAKHAGTDSFAPPMPAGEAATGNGSNAGPSLQGTRLPTPENLLLSTEGGSTASQRRGAKRRSAAAPVTKVVAANENAPSIGGLIYAMEQKPSRKPFIGASIATGIWIVLGSLFGWAMLSPQFSSATGLLDLFTTPAALTASATLLLPIAVFWAIAMLIWRSHEMKLMSSAMTEVAVRLAEPDRTAEQSVASLGQAVRRQVSFMNDAVERALGRAGELEALVHSEVASLEQSYAHNETRIRGLLKELSGERHALSSSSVEIVTTLQELGTEVPALIDKLSNQQVKLAHIIEGAGQNLTALETAMDASTGRLESKLGERTEALQGVLQDYTGALDSVMKTRSEQMTLAFAQYVENLDSSISDRTETLQTVFEEYTLALDTTLGDRAKLIDATVTDHTRLMDLTLAERTKAMDLTMSGHAHTIDGSMNAHAQVIDGTLSLHSEAMDQTFSGRSDHIDSTLAAHVEAMDTKLASRTQALNDAVSQRMALFDDTIQRTTLAFDGAVGEKAEIITEAIEAQARNLSDTLGRQAGQIDETLMHGINAVRRSSESITKQSLKAIEGLANQSDLLKNVSEGILQQIGNVTNRFEDQGQSIMKAANQLDRANSKIDLTLRNSNQELSKTLKNVSGQTEQLDTALETFSTGLQSAFSEAENRARVFTTDMTAGARMQSDEALASIEQIKTATDARTERALTDMRSQTTEVSHEMTASMDSLASQLTEGSKELRQRTHQAATDLESEQQRLQEQMRVIPTMTRDKSRAVSDALQDQLRALDQLSSLTSRVEERSVISAPVNGGNLPANALDIPQHQNAPAPVSPGLAAGPSPAPRAAAGQPVQQSPAQQPYQVTAPRQQQFPAGARASAEQHAPVAAPDNGPHRQPGPAAPTASARASLTASITARTKDISRSINEADKQAETSRTLHSITAAITRTDNPNERASTGRPSVTPAPARVAEPVSAAAAPAQAPHPSGWSVGDLLARASDEDSTNEQGIQQADAAVAASPAQMVPTTAAPETTAPVAGPQDDLSAPGIDIEAMADALNSTTAAAIWQKLRSGQHGTLARNLYTPEGRATFDETLERYAGNDSVRATIDRYLADFEQAMKSAEMAQQDPAIIEHTLHSAAGRVYLFLAHASGRLT